VSDFFSDIFLFAKKSKILSSQQSMKMGQVKPKLLPISRDISVKRSVYIVTIG
jgi:hypothetical protein